MREGPVYCEWCHPGLSKTGSSIPSWPLHQLLPLGSRPVWVFVLASFSDAVLCASVSQMNPFLPSLLWLWCFTAAIETFKTVGNLLHQLYALRFLLSISSHSFTFPLSSSLHVPFLFFLFSFPLWYLNYLIVVKNASKMHLPLSFPNNFWLLVQTSIWFLHFHCGMF